jgi:hypothetical protein
VKPSMQATASYLGIAVAALAIIWIVCGVTLRRLRNTRDGAELLADARSLNRSGD